jgi:hypothetical protein
LNTTANTYAAIQLAQKVGGSWGKVRIVCSGASNQGELGFQVENAGTFKEAMRIDGSGLVGIGCTPGEILQVRQSGANSPTILNECYSTTTSRCGNLTFNKSGSNTAGTVAATEDGEKLGKITFKGADLAPSFIESASITATCEGAPDADAQPAKLEFSTSDAASSQVRLTISSAGLATFANGIDVDSTGNFVKLEAYQNVSVADDATIPLSSGSCSSAIVSVYETSGGVGGVFFITYSGTAILIASNGSVAATDSDGNMCVYKSASSHTATFKNRMGSTKTFSVAQLGGYLV